MYLMRQASGCGEADARLSPVRSQRQCIGTLPLRRVLGLRLDH